MVKLCKSGKSLLLTFLLFISGSLWTQAQEIKVSIDFDKRPLRTVLAEIERQSQQNFSFKSNLVDKYKDVTIHLKNASFPTVLNNLAEATGLVYTRMSDDMVAITERSNLSKSNSVSVKPFNVSGVVTDEFKEPLIGATVMVKGTSNGAVTGMDGEFSINNLRSGDVLIVSYVGFQNKIVPLKGNGIMSSADRNKNTSANNSYLNIVLKKDAYTLNETVVVGYGTQKKINLTGAVTSVDGETLRDRPASTIGNMLQGAVAGLNITTDNGKPGSTPEFNIRGTASINGGSPLVLIDGAIGDINNVNPNDVQSVSVIKDASAAAVYGARAAFGVILVTTKNGTEKDGVATVRYNGRFGWDTPTTSTDYETTGYWSVYLVNKFWQANSGTDYMRYDTRDMEELLARVHDKTENPERPWVVEDIYDGKKVWKYYANTDWYHTLFKDNRFSQQHNISLSGGIKNLKYFVSGGLQTQDGILKAHNDKFKKYNFRAKLEFPVNKWLKFQNNTSLYSSSYSYQGDGTVENSLFYACRQALSCFPVTNPDGTYIYTSPYTDYKVATGRHILLLEGSHPNISRDIDFGNTFRLDYTPIKQLTISGDFTYRYTQNHLTKRRNNVYYRERPDDPLKVYDSGMGYNDLTEEFKTYNYYSVNALATYKDTFNDVHNLTAVAGYNYETRKYQRVRAYGRNLASTTLNDLDLVSPDTNGTTYTEVGGGQNQYALEGIFARVNYDYMGKYLIELSGRYDGSSRFAKGHRWGIFPSGSMGWRFSEEKFFEPLQPIWSNGKLRFSYGSLGNQNVSSYYTFLRLMGTADMAEFTFNEGPQFAQYATLGAPVASDLTWEKANQWDLGLDLGFLNNRLNLTTDFYVRDTKDMLCPGVALPSVYGASAPQMNAADLRTKGYEITVNWNDSFLLFGKNFSYGVGFNISDYRSHITKYDNEELSFAKDYYPGMRLGEIWGFCIDGFFDTTEEAQKYASEINLAYVAKKMGTGWQAGDVRYVDLDGDGKIGIGENSVKNPGDRKILGNSLPSLSYGFNANISYCGFDVSAVFQGTGNHYYYPDGKTMQFWGLYSYPYLSFIPADFKDKVWREDNKDSYFPRPMGYDATGGKLQFVNDRYIQNIRYLRFKNLTIGYTLPSKLTRKALMDKVRVYFTGENLCYWSPFKTKYIDPEGAFNHTASDGGGNFFFYPWSKTFMFGLDVQF